ncbi:acyl carrier protein [Roseivirga sp. BDSF3-8]|uniref:acyl carrier protein n=1 Tax=Roseivirga sp. BDSF3-8 TaxID=3241598 RepID=UPI0035325F65
MQREEIAQKVRLILIEKIGLKPTEVTPDANLTRDLGVDSLDYAELVMEFENAFQVRIPDTEAGKLNTFKEVVDYLLASVNTP